MDKTFFSHVSSDSDWVAQFSHPRNQTIDNNLLAKDVLGLSTMQADWLCLSSEPCEIKNAQIMAIKYENLWDSEIQEAMRLFLSEDLAELPPKKQRRYKPKNCDPLERKFRKAYNRGSIDEPLYRAYDLARVFWMTAPPYQFLKIRDIPRFQVNKSVN